MEALIYLALAVAAWLGLVWFTRWTERRDMREAIREVETINRARDRKAEVERRARSLL